MTLAQRSSRQVALRCAHQAAWLSPATWPSAAVSLTTLSRRKWSCCSNNAASSSAKQSEATQGDEDDDFSYEKETAFYCLSPSNPVRRTLFWLVRWRWFRAFIIVAILVNSALFGAYVPLNVDAPPNAVADGAEPVFLAIFASEAIVKLLAMGCIMHQAAYFRDGWNWYFCAW